MHPLMHEAALGGKTILGPYLFNMDQSALTRTKRVMLQGRKLNQIVRIVHIIVHYHIGLLLPNKETEIMPCYYHVYYRVHCILSRFLHFDHQTIPFHFDFNLFLLSGSDR
jgi:hypothetical protein